MNSMTVFIILNYLTVDETLESVRQIKKMMNTGLQIIIIDNASPNGAGVMLERALRSDPQVRVVQNKENSGFAQGNNLGYRIAKEYNPEFIVMQNNDIEYTQVNFLDLVKQEFDRSNFDILGPDIFVPETGIHQNPKKKSSYSISEIKHLVNESEKKFNRKKLLRIRVLLKRITFLKKLVLQWEQRKRKNLWKEPLTGAILHGSCLIFSKNFISSIAEPFDPRTFFYFETEILDLRLKKRGFVSSYTPKIKVLHHQNTSTKMASKDELGKTNFQLKNMIRSGKVAETYFEK